MESFIDLFIIGFQKLLCWYDDNPYLFQATYCMIKFYRYSIILITLLLIFYNTFMHRLSLCIEQGIKTSLKDKQSMSSLIRV